MTIQSIEAQLKKIDRQRERLHRELEVRKRTQFAALPGKVGLRNVDQLILSLAPYASSSLRTRLSANAASKPKAVRAVSSPKVDRTAGRKSRYSEEQKAAVRAAVAKGGKTVAEISKELGVAEYTIIDWKKKWGLVKKRKKTAPAKKK